MTDGGPDRIPPIWGIPDRDYPVLPQTRRLQDSQKAMLRDHWWFHIINETFTTKQELAEHMKLMEIFMAEGRTFDRAHELAVKFGPS